MRTVESKQIAYAESVIQDKIATNGEYWTVQEHVAEHFAKYNWYTVERVNNFWRITPNMSVTR